MATYLLIHGAWHGSWVWRKVTPLLEACGHHVIAPDLPGHEANGQPNGNITTQDYLNFLLEQLSQTHEPAICVGHSMAGLLIAQLAELIPDKIAEIMFIAGFCPNDGESLIDISKQFPVDTKALELNFDFDNKLVSLNTDSAIKTLYADCSAEDQQLAHDALQAQPLNPLLTATKLGEQYQQMPKTYIVCDNDASIAKETQLWMANRNNCAIKHINSSHSPFFSQPEQLTQLILI